MIKGGYLGQGVGLYYDDILVEVCLILELEAAECLLTEPELQPINYPDATGIEVGLLLNFGKKPESRRKIFPNSRTK
jgi:GxxExxY protein